MYGRFLSDIDGSLEDGFLHNDAAVFAEDLALDLLY